MEATKKIVVTSQEAFENKFIELLEGGFDLQGASEDNITHEFINNDGDVIELIRDYAMEENEIENDYEYELEDPTEDEYLNEYFLEMDICCNERIDFINDYYG